MIDIIQKIVDAMLSEFYTNDVMEISITKDYLRNCYAQLIKDKTLVLNKQ